MTRQISAGGVTIGGGAPVRIQSMLNTKTTDEAACLAQIAELKDLGCEIVRLAVPDRAAAEGLNRRCDELLRRGTALADAVFDRVKEELTTL